MLAVAFQLMTPTSVARGDVDNYAAHSAAILDGAVPYFDLEFEHFPISIAPIILPELLVALGIDYVSAFVFLTVAAFVALSVVVDRIGRFSGDPGAGRRWLLLTTPMLPFLLYRLDVWSTLFAALAYLAILETSTRRYNAFVLLGIGTKGWPAVYAAIDWVRGRRRQAVVFVATAAVLAAVLLATPGFRSGRSFTGIHIETLAGSLVLLSRPMQEIPVQIVTAAGAVYVEAGPWAIMANLAAGLSVAGASLVLLRRNNRSDHWLLSSAVFAVLLASPLLSAQFLLWVTPFAALVVRRSLHMFLAGAGAMTTALLTWWEPASFGWAVLLVSRNLLLIACVVALLSAPTDDHVGRTSRRNLPV